MMSSRTAERWTVIAALLVLIGPILLSRGSAGAAPAVEALLPPTPLVLKDGRIANVSIHVLPFVAGEAELAGDGAAQLAELTASVATDCFLTAQVIGHVSSGEVAQSETLAAHRLARSRADAVQASLIGGGLPAKAIASVWDWQFLVREPRATLWVFRLIRGEDCDGVPLDGAAALVAGAGQTPSTAGKSAGAAKAPAAATQEVAARADRKPAADAASETSQAEAAETSSLPAVVRSAVAAEAPARAPAQAAAKTETPQQPAQAAAKTETAQQSAQAAVETETKQPSRQAKAKASIAGGPAAEGVPVITRPLPAPSPAQGRPAQDRDRPASLASSPATGQTTGQPAVEQAGDLPAETTVAAVQPARATPARAAGSTAEPQLGDQQSGDQQPGDQQSAKRAEQHPERQGRVEAKDGDVIITFATNSSYFPAGASRRLRSMLDQMTGKSYRVQLQVGVSGSDQVVGASSPEEARRYNRWLAERRLGRVQEWLAENVHDRQLDIEPAFVADDDSRRVVVRIVPTG